MAEESTDKPDSLDRRVVGGTAWMILVKLCIRGIGIVSTLILARLLVAEDFGLIAMAMSVAAMVELLGAFSFDIVLIQNPNAERKHFDTVWTLNILFGIVMGFVLLLLAQPAAAFYQEARLIELIQVVAISVVVAGFENIGTVMFRKDLEFRREFNFMVSKKIIGFLVTIPLAIVWRNYWALMIGLVSASIGGVILSYIMHNYRPRLSLAARSEIFSFSVWLFINNMLFFARGRAADFVVGRLSGAHSLGVLTLSTEISQLATSEMVQPINRAVFPGYSKLNNSVAAVKTAYLDVVRAVAFFLIPAGVGVAIVAPELVPLALGEKWLDAVVPIQVLSIYGLLVAIQGNNGIVFLALGQPRTLTWLAALSVAIAIPILIFATRAGGVIGASYGLLVAVIAMLPFNFWAIRRTLKLGLLEWLGAFFRPAAASVVMLVACVFVRQYLPTGGAQDQLMTLLVTAGVGATTFTAVAYGLWRVAGRPKGPEQFAMARIQPMLDRIRAH